MPAKKSTTPKMSKKTAPKKSTKAAATKAAATKTAAAPVEVVAAPVVAAAPVEVAATPQVVETPTLEDGWTNIEAQFTSISTRLSEFKALYSSLTTDLRKLQKDVQRHIREASRKGKRKRRVVDPSKPPRAPSGFAKPSLISNELCSFLGKSPGTEMARTEVTKYLTTYIKEHSLQDSGNKRKINPDAKLKKLLNVGPKDEVTYFNLQKYMKVHFPKTTASASS